MTVLIRVGREVVEINDDSGSGVCRVMQERRRRRRIILHRLSNRGMEEKKEVTKNKEG